MAANWHKCMIEAGAKEVPNDVMFNGIMAGHEANQQIIAFIQEIQKEVGREKVDFPSNDPSPELFVQCQPHSLVKSTRFLVLRMPAE